MKEQLLSVLTSRGVQLLARAIAFLLAMIAGKEFAASAVDEQTQLSIEQFAASAAELLIAFALLAWDGFIHRKKTGGVLRPAGTVNESPKR